jgi:hypothetical protein
MPTWGYGEDIHVRQRPTNTHTCPAEDKGKICGKQITLDKPFEAGDPQISVTCPNPNGLKPHAFHIFTVSNPESPALDGTIQTFASTDIHD